MSVPRRALLNGAAHALYAAGGDRVLRAFVNRFEARRDDRGRVRFPYVRARREPSLQILLYHRVTPEPDPFLPPLALTTFRSQMEHLARHFKVYRLDQAIDALAWGGLAQDAVAITFDDGYRDNHEHAWPILRDLGLSATFFLATDAIGTGRLLWHDRVFRAFTVTDVRELRGFGPQGDHWAMGTADERTRSRERFLAFVRTLDNLERRRWVDELERRLHIEPEPRDRDLMMTWDHARRMAREGAHFGAHTVTHPILSRLPHDEARREIADSKAAIEREIGAKVDCFAYPNGQPTDYDATIKSMLRDGGFRIAVTTTFGSNRRVDGSLPELHDLRRGVAESYEGIDFGARMAYYRFAF